MICVFLLKHWAVANVFTTLSHRGATNPVKVLMLRPTQLWNVSLLFFAYWYPLLAKRLSVTSQTSISREIFWLVDFLISTMSAHLQTKTDLKSSTAPRKFCDKTLLLRHRLFSVQYDILLSSQKKKRPSRCCNVSSSAGNPLFCQTIDACKWWDSQWKKSTIPLTSCQTWLSATKYLTTARILKIFPAFLNLSQLMTWFKSMASKLSSNPKSLPWLDLTRALKPEQWLRSSQWI